MIDNTTINISFLKDEIDDPEEECNYEVQPYLNSEDDVHQIKKAALNNHEREWFKDLEHEARSSWPRFRELCISLYYIKEHELYRETHSSFADYCKDRLRLDHVSDRPNTPASVQVPREWASGIRSVISKNPEKVRSIACFMTAFASPPPNAN